MLILNNEMPLIAGFNTRCQVINRYYHLKLKACNDAVFSGFHEISRGFKGGVEGKAKDTRTNA